MRATPDGFYSLAIVDPPYGIGMASGFVVGESMGLRREKNGSTSFIPRGNYARRNWDNETPSKEYFNELMRVSRNQIIWGGNYFDLGSATCYIVWDKDNGGTNQSDCELAWTSFTTAIRKFRYMWNGMVQEEQNKMRVEKRIHPTQKPVALYKWLLTNYAKPGDTILDTHLGSGSSRIAAYDLGFDFVGYELDCEYWSAAEERFQRHVAQGRLFQPDNPVAKQEQLFSQIAA